MQIKKGWFLFYSREHGKCSDLIFFSDSKYLCRGKVSEKSSNFLPYPEIYKKKELEYHVGAHVKNALKMSDDVM